VLFNDVKQVVETVAKQKVLERITSSDLLP